MKKFTKPKTAYVLAGLMLFGYSTQLAAQCNVNDKYDKIISGYHSSIALKDNGVYAVWGSAMQKTGVATSGDQLSPQDINATNYTGLTGTIYKAALGGKSAGAAVDQGILLTSDGLWAWGIENNVLSTNYTASATFARITSPTGATALGLPTGVTPTDVQSLFATYQTLILVTKIVAGTGGDVWVLTQTSLAVEGNGGAVATAGSSTWQKVKINAGTYLTNVTAARGQVYNASNNAFIAVTAAGLVYTWGNTTYLGNASAITARNYATQMTLPSEFASSVPKMIGVTGGGGTGATTVTNTYYILSNAGNLYSLGNNSQRQCGDFTTTERTSWVQVKKTVTANDYLTNVNTFSCQEHNASFPAVAVVTSTGGIYTWGNNNSGMLGRTDDGTMAGTLSTVSFDPGVPVGFTGTAVSIEMGGHTMVYTKTGSTQFCYVGHYTNGSMGDGTAGNNGSSAATSLKHDCSSTPSLSICGYVPVTPSAITSTISASSTSILANGSSTTTLTIQLKDVNGVNLTSSGGVVVVNTSAGTVGTVVDNNNGTYTVILTSSNAQVTANITYTINGTAASNSASVTFTNPLPITWVNVVAYRQNQTVKVQWNTAQEFNVNQFDIERSTNSTDWQVVVAKIPATNTSVAHSYLETDADYTPQRVYYRVKQTDLNGRFTYSPVVLVAADNGKDKIVVYPVPVTNTFYVDNVKPGNIKKLELITLNGSVVRTWFNGQTSYDISNISKGIYILKITTADDVATFVKLSKQ
jgi:alpha-tubulin suppressor-like RCC1 family protein